MKLPTQPEVSDDTRESRRDFLRKSTYAAYASPFMLTLLVEKANAAKSWNPGRGEITHPATPKPPAGGTVGPHPGRGRPESHPGRGRI